MFRVLLPVVCNGVLFSYPASVTQPAAMQNNNMAIPVLAGSQCNLMQLYNWASKFIYCLPGQSNTLGTCLQLRVYNSDVQ